MSHFEEVRRSYRPRRITTLFVGESAPHGGAFFYNQDSGLFREMRKAFHGGGSFLAQFKRHGFYLDDVSLEPVNQLNSASRVARLNQSVSTFAERLRDYRPQAIVILLISIKSMVIRAMRAADLSYEPFCTPYPGFGNQPRFQTAMAEIIPNLPTISGSKWKEL
jgi:hypothetical protein